MNCPLCASIAELKTTEQEGYIEPDKFSIYHCFNCETAFCIPRVDATNVYDLIYKEGSKNPGYGRYLYISEEIKKKKNPLSYLASKNEGYWGVEEILKRILHTDKKVNILEVGCGLGYFTYALRKDGFINSKGIDISQEAVESAKAKYGDFFLQADIFEYSKTHSNEFDVVILTDVIEHVLEPLGFLRALKNLIKDSGVIILTTLNKSFHSKEAIWQTDAPPVHYWWFSENSIKILAKSMDMQANFVDYKPFYKINPKRKHVAKLKFGHVYNKDLQLNTSNTGILPNWLKKTKLFKEFLTKTNIYQLIRIYQLQAKNNYIKVEDCSPILCAYFSNF